MGRIKTTLIKRTGRKLVALHKENFAPDFEKNKPLVHEYLPRANKKMKNIVAGYVTRLIKQEEQKKT